MMRSTAAIRTEMLETLGPGWVWPRARDTLLAGVLMGPAAVFADAGRRMGDLLRESIVSGAVEMLPEYERILGPDPCGRDLLATSLAQRQMIAAHRWTSGGSGTIAFFRQLARGLGTAITITEYDPFECGVSVCGDELADEDSRFYWLVTLPPTRVVDFECGVSECGDLLGELTPALLECVIRHYAPAHTTPIFEYLEE